MQILYIKPYPGEIDQVRSDLSEVTIHEAVDVFKVSDEVRSQVEVLSVFVDYQVTAEVLEALPNLKLIATRSSGFDHIDLEAAKKHNVTISRVPHYGTRTVAEYAFALMFALSRQAFRSYTDLQKQSVVEDLSVYEGFDLANKTLGVIGVGAIGRNVCQIGVGLGMKVLAYDVSPDEEFAAKTGFSYVSMAALLSVSDIVTLHVPAMPETHHLINADRLAQMPVGSRLINTSRGSVVDSQALIAAIESGRLAGAGLDVLEGEHELKEEAVLLTGNGLDAETWKKLVADHVLIDHPQVIVTPHIAFNTKEAKREITTTTVENILAWQNNLPQNTVS